MLPFLLFITSICGFDNWPAKGLKSKSCSSSYMDFILCSYFTLIALIISPSALLGQNRNLQTENWQLPWINFKNLHNKVTCIIRFHSNILSYFSASHLVQCNWSVWNDEAVLNASILIPIFNFSTVIYIDICYCSPSNILARP